MININLDGLVIAVEDPALACACEHDSCFARQNDPDHHEECDCPKVTGMLALSVAPIHDDSWDSVHWAHVTREELLEGLDDLRFHLLSTTELAGAKHESQRQQR